MGNIISVDGAARVVAQKVRGIRDAEARRSIIGGLAAGELQAAASSFERFARLDNGAQFYARNVDGYEIGPINDCVVPSDFWRPGHSQHTGDDVRQFPTGASGNHQTGAFRFCVVRFASAAAKEPGFNFLNDLSYRPVDVESHARGIGIERDALDRWLEFRRNRTALMRPWQALESAPKRATRTPSGQSLNLYADFALICLAGTIFDGSDQERSAQIIKNPAAVARVLRSLNGDEAPVDDAIIKRFAAIVAFRAAGRNIDDWTAAQSFAGEMAGAPIA